MFLAAELGLGAAEEARLVSVLTLHLGRLAIAQVAGDKGSSRGRTSLNPARSHLGSTRCCSGSGSYYPESQEYTKTISMKIGCYDRAPQMLV